LFHFADPSSLLRNNGALRIDTAAMPASTGPQFREPGKIVATMEQSQGDPILFSRCRAEMSGMGGVSGSVVNHRIQSGS
jgi:hypothetical protein